MGYFYKCVIRMPAYEQYWEICNFVLEKYWNFTLKMRLWELFFIVSVYRLDPLIPSRKKKLLGLVITLQ